MRYLAALTAVGLLASTAAFAQNTPSTDQSSQGQSSQSTNQATGAPGGQALSQPFVRRIQLRLKQEGEYDGKVTGTYDQETANAVKEFQEQNNIQPTGQIDGYTIIALMRPNMSGAGEGSSGEGSSVEGSAGAPGGAMGGQNRPTVAIPLMRIYERGYQQGFEQGLRWAQQQDQQQ
jgi:peptidoglycan hydrolase-like protein with peptidoglycan-binding domain